MEGHKHFSHAHSLNNYQVPQGIQVIICSGCKSTATDTIYACLQCKFYLHENCFRATRSLQHPSHPSHPLNLFPYPTYPSNSFYCNICTLIGTGFSYSCSNCQFDIHIHCAYNTNSSHQNLSPEAPSRAYTPHHLIQHHPTSVVPFQNHEIYPPTLISTPPYKYSTESTSNASHNHGSGSTHECATCQSDLNALCSSLSEMVEIVKGGALQYPVAQNDREKFDLSSHVEHVKSDASRIQENLDKLAVAELTSKFAKRNRESILEMFDPPGTVYKYRYY